jgi:hypothetical protein
VQVAIPFLLHQAHRKQVLVEREPLIGKQEVLRQQLLQLRMVKDILLIHLVERSQ